MNLYEPTDPLSYGPNKQLNGLVHPTFQWLIFHEKVTYSPSHRHIFISLYDGGLGEAFHGSGMGAPNDLPSGLSLV
jgi:hypothetical protein